jgi:perosamine synthetase
MQRLREKGVETRPFFLGMHEQPVFHRLGLFCNEQYPVAERLARRGFYIPNGLALSEEQIAIVIAAVKECLA